MKAPTLKLIILPIVAASCASACSSKEPKRPEFVEYFATHIGEDGTKQFSLALEPQGRGGGGPRGGRGRGNGPPGGGSGRGSGGPNRGAPDRAEMQQRMEQMLTARLDAQLQQTGFCEVGYTVLDQTTVVQGLMTVRGECNDKATDQDREQFPND
ncbi:MAG: hypothetical protein DHS20C11_22150 [Lysobacteraceae bacterium]|nr:MAG: hypothetical protein DHS20C11_22150 [Xanthomonadaceae bacterium]